MPIVNIPSVGNIEFPEGMSPENIAAAIKANYPDLGKTGPMTTPGEVLASENRPVEKGVTAAGESASKGVLGTLGAVGAGMGEAAGTSAHNILSNIPGLGGPGGVVPAAGAALAHAGGTFLGDTVTGGILGKGLGMVKALPEAITNITKAGKLGTISKTLEQPATLAEQISTPLSGKVSALYKAAETQSRVPSTQLTHTIFDSFMKEQGMANPNKVVSSTLEGLYNKFANSTGMAYEDVLNEVQRLRRTARGFADKQPQAQKALNDVAESLMTTLDMTSPVARQAGLLARKNIAGKEILDTLMTPNPGDKIKRMFLDEPQLAPLFNLNTPEDINKFLNLVTKYGKPSTALGTAGKVAIGAGGTYAAHKLYSTLFGGSHGSGY